MSQKVVINIYTGEHLTNMKCGLATKKPFQANQVFSFIVNLCHITFVLLKIFFVREGFKNPSNGNFPLRGGTVDQKRG